VSIYRALFSIAFQQHLQYRVAAVAGAVTNIAFGFFRIFLLTAFYSAAAASQPMTLAQVYSYIWFGQVLFGVLPLTGLMGPDADEIRSGDIAYRLTRPVSLWGFTYARALAQKAAALASRSLVQIAVLFALLPALGLHRFSMGLPVLNQLPFLAASLALTVLLSAALHSVVTMSSFWTISPRGSASLAYAVISLFSGLLVPLAFFPPTLRGLADLLPFRAVYDTPAMLYAGTLTVRQACLGLGHQIIWLGATIALGAWLARRGTARLEVAGG
jgi:ABC-2 type transport system permease protein